MAPSPSPDADLVAATAAGDEGAFAALYERHAPRLMAFLAALLRDRATAEDAVQETFVQVWRSARRFRPGAPFEPWLYRIGRNEAYDLARRRRGRAAPAGAPSPDPSAREVGSVGPPRGDARPADAPARDAELAAALDAGVAALSPRLREAFVLVRLLHRPYDETAGLLGIPVGTVKSRVAAADAALRRTLEPFA